jgi:hypothetical protein
MMFRAVLWKEYREQRSICLTLAVVSAAALLVAHAALSSGGDGYSVPDRDMLAAVAGSLAWMCGLICGAMLLAGEREGGTQDFLDTLPTGRWPLWLAKCLVGILFLLVLLAVVAGLAGWLLWPTGDQPPEQSRWFWGAVILVAGLAGYGWGIFFSALTRSVLAAAGLAILVQLGFWATVLALLVVFEALVLAVLRIHGDIRFSPLVVGFLWLALPLPLSALVYSRVDRLRRPSREAAPWLVSHWLEGWRQCLGLGWMQVRGLYLGVLLGCVAGAVLVVVNFALFWPLVTLIVGVVCGVTTFNDEQGGAYRFLGDQRLPLTRLWLVKFGLRLVLAGLACLVLFLPALFFVALRDAEHYTPRAGPMLGSYLLSLGLSPVAFAFTWVLHGLAVGQLCGLVFRKPLVALVVSVGLAALLAAVWTPSLLLGGLHAWQVLAVPLVLVVCAWRLLPAWATDRLASRRVLVRLALAGLLCVGLVVLGLWWRVAEVPAVARPDDFDAFVEHLDEASQNRVGVNLRNALDGLQDQKRLLTTQQTDTVRECDEVIRHGWPDKKPELAVALDRVFASDVWKLFPRDDALPAGLVDDPRRPLTPAVLQHAGTARAAGKLLAARGLQMQTTSGRPEVFVDNLRTTLVLVRNLENGAPSQSAVNAVLVESDQMVTLDRWLERCTGRPDLLRQALDVVRRHRDRVPADYHERRYADYLQARDTLASPQDWLPLPFSANETANVEVALVTTALELPWEQAREQRLIAQRYLGGWPNAFPALVPHVPQAHPAADDSAPRRRCRLDAAVLKLALRLYQCEKGRPADSLKQLVPAYLDTVPRDPFDGAAFRYRLSAGEEIAWPVEEVRSRVVHPEAVRKVRPGQGVLWSVGEDKMDDGGKRRFQPGAKCQAGEDVIYVVPLPASKAG